MIATPLKYGSVVYPTFIDPLKMNKHATSQ